MRESSNDTEQSGEVLTGVVVHCINEVGGSPSEVSSLASEKTSIFTILVSIVEGIFGLIIFSTGVMESEVSISTVVRSEMLVTEGEIITKLAVFVIGGGSAGSSTGEIVKAEIKLGTPALSCSELF